MKHLKILVSLIMCMLCLSFSFIIAAADSFSAENVKLDLPDGFTRLTTKNLSKYSDLLRRLGYTEGTFKQELSTDGMLLFAVTEDASHQINMKITQSGLSSKIGYIDDQSDERIEEIARTIEEGVNEQGFSSVKSRETLSSNGITFISLTVSVVNGEKQFCYIQYYTIVNGLNYSLVYYNNSPEISAEEKAECDEMFSSLKIKNTSSGNVDYMGAIQIIIATVAIIVFIVLLAWIIISLVTDYKKYKRESSIQKLNRK